MIGRRNLLPVLLALLLPLTCNAAIESREFDNPAQEARYTDLIKKLRCLVCQNQNLADSNAELARDLRDKTYDMIVAGSSDDEITEFMVNRYGSFVLYEPPLNFQTLFLWLTPGLLAAIGGGIFVAMVRRRRRAGEAPAAPAVDVTEARALLDSTEKRS